MQYRIDTILYGYPKGNGAVTQKIDTFIQNLAFSVASDVVFQAIDEHFSSTQASERSGDVGKKHISQDTISAMVILERFLATQV